MSQSTHDNDPTWLPFAKATRLMAQGLSEAGASSHSVANRVAAAGGAAWLGRIYTEAMGGWPPGPAIPLPDLLALKDRCKRKAEESADAEACLAAHAVYLYCIAAAIVSHGCLISARSREQVDDALVDLASVAPEPWRRLFMDAAMASATRLGA
jgi:hypothetical protein